MIARPGTSAFLFRKPATSSSVPTPTVYWEADYGVVTTTNGTTADSSPVSGNKVLSWTSKDASASVASFGYNSFRPTYYTSGSGKPFVRFDGQQNQQLSATGPASLFNNAQQYTMGVAFRAAPIYPAGYRNQQYLTLDNGSQNTNTLISQGTMQFGLWAGNIGQRVLLSNSQQLWGENTYFGTFNTSSTTSTPAAQSTKVYTNGTLAASDTTSTAGVSPCSALVMGIADSTAGYSTINDYYGAYFYTSELNATQIAAVHNDISSRMFSWRTLPVSGAALWLDGSRPSTLWDTTALGSNVYSNGGAIGQWNDLSGNSRNAIAGTTAYSSTNRPTWNSPAVGLNGLGTLKFNGTSNYMFIPASSYSAYTLFIVAQNNDLSNGSVLLGKSSGSTDYVLMGSVFRVEMTSTSDQINTARTNNTAWNYLTCKYDGSSGTPYVNGVIGTVKTGISGSTLDSNCIGYYATTSYILDGQIAELVLFNSALNDTDRASVESYLKAKWGL